MKDNYYGFAIVDNDLEKVGGYSIEPPTLFKGRGIHPKAGMMKVIESSLGPAYIGMF